MPIVMSRAEITKLLEAMDGTTGLIARLLYGTGLRVLEGLRLRVKDVDFDRGQVIVHDGKGRVKGFTAYYAVSPHAI